MKIFISGATGFVGQHLIPQLIYNGHTVSILLRQNSNRAVAAKYNVESFCDNEDTGELVKYFHDNHFDGIIHLAAYYVPEHKPDDISELIKANVLLGTRLMDAASRNNVTWFLNTGTFWQHYNNADYSPVNLYAATKQALDTIARYYQEVYGLCFCTLKLNDTYGPNDTRPKLINFWKANSNTGKCMEMSPGDQLIDIVHVDDVVSAFLKILNLLATSSDEYNGKSYVVSSGKSLTLKQLAKIFEQSRQATLNIKWGAKPYRRREVMSPYSRGIVVPGWSPQITLEDGLRNI